MNLPTPEQRLSKSRYVQGLQCLRQLWWRVHEPEALELIPDFETRARFEEGHRVGARARRHVPGGVLIGGPHDQLSGRVEATRKAIEGGARVIYEAAFIAEATYVAVDILERIDGGFALVEVKSSTEPKLEHLNDAAVQTWVLRRSGLAVPRVEVMHLDAECVHPHLDRLFVRADVTAQVEELLPAVPGTLERQRASLAGPLPEVAIGPHCNRPYACPFRSRCWNGLPRHPITSLYAAGSKAFELLAAGYSRVADLPDDLPLDPIPARQRRALKTGRVVVEPGLAEAMAGFEPPLAYLDFETVAPAIPAWPGCHPFESVPVQFSCRIERGGAFENHDWLAEAGVDPRAELAARLIDACRGARTVIAYSADFEARAIRHLEAAVPDRAEELAELRGRLRDPLPLLREYVHHPEFGGSFGLKAVAPALAPDVRYSRAGVPGGGVATVLLARLLLDGEPNDFFERDRVRESLLRYCALDTFATQRVVERLRELAAAS